MPRLPDEILDCVVYLYPSEAAAENGEQIGGTGFLVGLPLADESRHIVAHLPCVVTNKHIIRNGSMVVRLNTRDEKTDIIALDGAEWITHPKGDDLAACPIGLSVMHKYNVLPLQAWSGSAFEGFEIGIGDEAFVLGRFINLEGRQQNTPTVRFGTIAQMPKEPIVQDDGFPQDSFLVEIRSISGYSGSPVFWYIPPQPSLDSVPKEMQKHIFQSFMMLRERRTGLFTGAGPYLLGVGYCYIPWKEPVRNSITKKQVDNQYVQSNTGMMGVIPVWKLTEMLLGDAMTKVRENAEIELRIRKEGSGVVLTSAEAEAPSAKEENPQHREDFTRLVGAAARKPTRAD